jgi:beta-fructofuranosidase
MLLLEDRWVWDHWLVDSGSAWHLFYLQAPRSLGDPDLRHANATTGHAVSPDLVHWTVLPDALLPGAPGAWDDRATWTGSIIRNGPEWVLAYTGSAHGERGLIQRVGIATSTDLVSWTRVGDAPAIEADARWYERLDQGTWFDEAFRDPWLLRDPDGDGWHALITARAREGDPDCRGVVGHAWSPDLRRWEVRPPLSAPGEFGTLEVLQVAEIEPGRWVLSFSAVARELSGARRMRTGETRNGMYLCPADGPLGPFHVEDAVLITELYAGRLVRRRDGSWAAMGFLDRDAEGRFVGAISDPIPLAELPAVGALRR